MLRRVAISCMLISLTLPAMARTRPHYGGTVRIETQGDPWQKPDGIARRLVLDGLTQIEGNGGVGPALAISWTSENAEHRWQFKLRPGVHFHDGSTLTSTVVVSSLIGSCGNHCPWTAVRAVGMSVVFTSDDPMPALPALLAADEFLITQFPAINTTGAGAPIGTGPFQVVSSSNGSVTLSANDSAWQGRPFADTVEIRAHRNINDQWTDLAAGRADVAEVPAESIRQAQQQKLSLLISQPVGLLALQVSENGSLANPNLRAAIACAVDRSALANVIYQKQGQASAAVLPQALSGYAFLFPTDRDLNKAHELRGGITPPALRLQVDGGGAMQLAAQRIVLNLHDAGFAVQIVPAGQAHADLTLRMIRLEGGEPAAVLASVSRAVGQPAAVSGSSPEVLYQAEHGLLDRKLLIPLLHVPYAYAIGSRMRDARFSANGMPDLANVSVGPTQ